ncbi:twin transmembrane helix small protein [Roseomonas frigidaquae]|uniref:Twin transmembrane helix small protein n=1 Tax=Falsiroseomonas frigidaquae TaxID=487318 RepID=A0ABX1EV64_9PROT|nr:twin transmembrane helix small protein [Falsiroseomonas frigidaquae]NKE44475.1 twin transmembrane helix small protein [Falsiroseomonas frigidaquae]
MTTFLTVLVGLSMFATLGVMFAGMLGLARNEAAGGARSNRLMRWRVALQGVTLVLFLILILATRG